MYDLYIHVLVVVCLLFLLWLLSCYRLWKAYKANSLVRFGAQALSGLLNPNGQPIYLAPTTPTPGPGGLPTYRHWCLTPNAPKIAAGVQCLITIIMLIALAVDSWTQDYQPGGTIMGLTSIRSSYYGSLTYTDVEAPDLALGGALTLVLSLIAMIIMCGQLHQLISIVYGTVQYHEYHYYLARLQVIQLIDVILMWFDAGYIRPHGLGYVGPSWLLVVVCLGMSWWMLRYVRAAIEFRPPSSATAAVGPANGVQMNNMMVQPTPNGACNPAGAGGVVVHLEGQPSVQSQSFPPSPSAYQQQYQPRVAPAIIYPSQPAYTSAVAPAPINGQPVHVGQIGGGYASAQTNPGAVPSSAVPSVKRFCYSCGTAVPPHLQTTVQFCANCGTSLAQ